MRQMTASPAANLNSEHDTIGLSDVDTRQQQAEGSSVHTL